MVEHLKRIVLVVTLAAAGLAFARVEYRQPHDLDEYSNEELMQDLIAELDDLVYEDGFDPNQNYALNQLQGYLMEALGDGGDDESEGDIDFYDLQLEMQEAQTTVNQVVWGALYTADEISGNDELPSRDNGGLRPAGMRNGGQPRKRNNFATTRVAIDQTARAVVYYVRLPGSK